MTQQDKQDRQRLSKPLPLDVVLLQQLKAMKSTGPGWPPSLNKLSRMLSEEARVRCSQCRGTTSNGSCPMCHGTGLVCPRCRGMRFVRTGMDGWVTQIERCTLCLDAKDEYAAISKYLNNWFKHHPVTIAEEETTDGNA